MSPYLVALGLMVAAAIISAVGAIYYATHHELSVRRWQRALDHRRSEPADPGALVRASPPAVRREE